LNWSFVYVITPSLILFIPGVLLAALLHFDYYRYHEDNPDKISRLPVIPQSDHDGDGYAVAFPITLPAFPKPYFKTGLIAWCSSQLLMFVLYVIISLVGSLPHEYGVVEYTLRWFPVGTSFIVGATFVFAQHKGEFNRLMLHRESLGRAVIARRSALGRTRDDGATLPLVEHKPV
jgi:hypothetical protein